MTQKSCVTVLMGQEIVERHCVPTFAYDSVDKNRVQSIRVFHRNYEGREKLKL